MSYVHARTFEVYLIRLFPAAIPHDEEIALNPIPKAERDALFGRARKILNIHNDQYDMSMRHTTVKDTLLAKLPAERQVQSLPLAVERRADNPAYVTWSGANTVLGDVSAYGNRFTLMSETRFTKLHLDPLEGQTVLGAELRDMRNDDDILVIADVSFPSLSLRAELTEINFLGLCHYGWRCLHSPDSLQ